MLISFGDIHYMQSLVLGVTSKLVSLQYDTEYYYAVGIGHTVRKFWFTTPPAVGPDVPYTFGLIGNFADTI